MAKAVIEKYLRTWAEADALKAGNLIETGAYDRVVVFPSYKDTDLLDDAIASVQQCAKQMRLKALCIVVLNCKQSDPAPLKKECLHKADTLSEQEGILCLQRVFPDDQGVGLARKLGCDIALALIQEGRVNLPWIWTTDADVRVPQDYLTIPHDQNAAAMNMNFLHVPIDPLAKSWQALKAYDCSLRYYVAGLAHAESPYAFHTIGSTLCIQADAYAKVRGFPKRLAGEDFHILNKLAKVGRITESRTNPIRILDRPSDRVPFGTGAAVAKISSFTDHEEEYLFYHPQIFVELRTFIQKIRAADPELPHGNLLDEELGLYKAIASARAKSKNEAMFLKHFFTWFDALKHLRFVHTLRDHCYASLPFQKVRALLPETIGIDIAFAPEELQ